MALKASLDGAEECPARERKAAKILDLIIRDILRLHSEFQALPNGKTVTLTLCSKRLSTTKALALSRKLSAM